VPEQLKLLTFYEPNGLSKYGFDYGEMFLYKVFRPATGDEMTLSVEYDPSLPNLGMFADQGLSAVKSVTLHGGSSSETLKISAEIYPNPSDGIFNLSMNYWPENMKIELLDATGHLLNQYEPGKRPNGASVEFNFTHLSDGVYFIKLVDQNIIETKKLVIQ